MDNPKISAFIVAYNRAEMLPSVIRGVAFADEIVVVDKSSTDETAAVAREMATKVITVPWTPTVEETRVTAFDHCAHDWILFLDDDEILAPGADKAIRYRLRAPDANVYEFPLRHYILGTHDESAYYWPEYHIRLFRRGSLRFGDRVHAGISVLASHIGRIDGACIHHLSHPDVATWIEKTNRYTSRPDRARAPDDGSDLVAFAAGRIAHWTAGAQPDSYAAAVGVLRAVYDIVDRLKTWEEHRGLDGHAMFRETRDRLDRARERFIPADPSNDMVCCGRPAGMSHVSRAAATPTLRACQSVLRTDGIIRRVFRRLLE